VRTNKITNSKLEIPNSKQIQMIKTKNSKFQTNSKGRQRVRNFRFRCQVSNFKLRICFCNFRGSDLFRILSFEPRASSSGDWNLFRISKFGFVQRFLEAEIEG